MKNRVSARPSRRLVTPEGGPPFYATITRADDPVVEGTPLDKAHLLDDTTAAYLKLADNDATVNMALRRGTTTTYYCNGTNDNIIISQMIRDFFTAPDLPDAAHMRINIHGVVGETGAYSASETVSTVLTDWDLSTPTYHAQRRLTLDFTHATLEKAIVPVPGTGKIKASRFFIALPIDVIGCNNNIEATVSTSVPLYGYYGAGCSLWNCTAIVTGNGQYNYGFAISDGMLVNCNAIVTGRGNNPQNETVGLFGSGSCVGCSATVVSTNGYTTGAGYEGTIERCHISVSTAKGRAVGIGGGTLMVYQCHVSIIHSGGVYSSDYAVGVKGAGTVDNCDIRVVGGAGETIGVYTLGSAYVSSCTINTYRLAQLATTMHYGVYAVGTSADNVIVANCTLPNVPYANYALRTGGILFEGTTDGVSYVVSDNIIHYRNFAVNAHGRLGNIIADNVKIQI